jgi:hypothetical protein
MTVGKVKDFNFGGKVNCYAKGGAVKPKMVKPMAPPIKRAPMVSRAAPMPMAPVAAPVMAMKKGGSTTKLGPKGQAKVGVVMREFKKGDLHSGKDGKVVTNRKQGIAIALSEGKKVSRK